MTSPKLSLLLAASFVLAALGSAPIPLFHLAGYNDLKTDTLSLSAFVVGPVWVILVSIARRRYGKRALWIFIGLPFALYSTGLMIFFIVGCLMGHCF